MHSTKNLLLILEILLSCFILHSRSEPCSHKLEVPNYRITSSITEDFPMATFVVEVSEIEDANFWIGLGISPVGGMTGADLVITEFKGGKFSEFQDYHGTGNKAPTVDTANDNNWDVTVSNDVENGTISFIVKKQFQAPSEREDVSLEDKEQYVLWAMGKFKTDGSPDYHQGSRGFHKINLLRCNTGGDDGNSASTNALTYPIFNLLFLIILSKLL